MAMEEELPPDQNTNAVEYDDEDDELYAVVSSGRPGGSLAPIRPGAEEESDDSFHTIEFMHDVPLKLSVEIGQAELTVKDILGLNVGSIVEFTKVVGEPMDIIVGGRLMARGEVVVVNERYGIRISEITRPEETGSMFD